MFNSVVDSESMEPPYLLIAVVSLNFCVALNQLISEESSVSQNCTVVRDAFANASSDFIKCSIESSRPIKFCENCVKQYINVLDSYTNMSKTINNGSSCLNTFVNLDRLGIVQVLYENTMNLWNRAKCYECFITENGKVTDKLSNETTIFNSLYTGFTKCLEGKNGSVCMDCMDKYLSLQDYFLSISNENEKIGVCMDLVDLMNNTWIYWGDTCCRYRRHNEYTFIISTVLVLVVTASFYIIVQVYTKNKLPTIVEQTRFLNTLEK